MNRKKFFNSLNEFPDGEGFNALPIAFVYMESVIARSVLCDEAISNSMREIASGGRTPPSQHSMARAPLASVHLAHVQV